MTDPTDAELRALCEAYAAKPGPKLLRNLEVVARTALPRLLDERDGLNLRLRKAECSVVALVAERDALLADWRMVRDAFNRAVDEPDTKRIHFVAALAIAQKHANKEGSAK